MALSKNTTVEFDSGLSIPVNDAYIRIDTYSGNKTDTTIYVNTYLSKAHCEADRASLIPTKIVSFNHDTSEEAPNIVKQGYEFLKTLSEFADAIDA